MEIPRVMVGEGSTREVTLDFPLRANIAEGLELERPPRRRKGLPGHW